MTAPKVGDAANVEHADVVDPAREWLSHRLPVVAEYDFFYDSWLFDGVAIDPAFVLGWLLASTEPGTGPQFDLGDDACWPIVEYAAAVPSIVAALTDERLVGLRPLGVIAHRDVVLPYHRDKRAPAGTTHNATLLSSRRCTGGELVLAEHRVAFRPVDGTFVVFDGQTLHGVAPFTLDEPAGYRLSLTVYLGP